MDKTLSIISNDQPGHVLVVDDEENIRVFFRNFLEKNGYRVTEADGGKRALEMISESLPDVVLLDIMMPGMDGFEVCRRLKGDPQTSHIPIIIVTALEERQKRLKGLEAGADEFITKPIDHQEINVRVGNAIRTKKLFDQVQESRERLEELEILRDNLTSMIIHDMKSLLTALIGYLELIQMSVEAKLNENEIKYLKGALEISAALTEMVASLLDISRLEAGEMPVRLSKYDLGSLVDEALNLLGAKMGSSRVRYESPTEPVTVYCDPDLIRRVITNILNNAIKLTPKDGEVRITVGGHGDQARVAITDNGPGIPQEYHEKIFEKFGQVEMREQEKMYSTGLGLTFCKLAVEVLGGEIGLDSEVGKGSTFWFVLPGLQESIQQ